jgi:hypothetical protein
VPERMHSAVIAWTTKSPNKKTPLILMPYFYKAIKAINYGFSTF